jgi:hypothetical protein
MPCHQEATAIHAIPAMANACGFRLLVLREFRQDAAPPAFALIEQRLLRTPERKNRHGLSFAAAFRPEIMDWLIAQLGRPSLHAPAGQAYRNPRWPSLTWHAEDRSWPDGLKTVEWFAEVTFADEASWAAFEARWRGRLLGESEDAGT